MSRLSISIEPKTGGSTKAREDPIAYINLDNVCMKSLIICPRHSQRTFFHVSQRLDYYLNSLQTSFAVSLCRHPVATATATVFHRLSKENPQHSFGAAHRAHCNNLIRCCRWRWKMYQREQWRRMLATLTNWGNGTASRTRKKKQERSEELMKWYSSHFQAHEEAAATADR